MKIRSKQQGFALLLFVTVLATAATTLTVKALNNNGNVRIDRDKITASALAQAKDALIGYAASDSTRPGELPCPDIDGDGMLSIGVDYNYGNKSCKSYIGFLPWKTLDLPELRDGANAKLWYAVSQNFYAGNNALLNSDTFGTITVRDSSGNIINNGCSINCLPLRTSDAAFDTGAIAVIIAPGDTLKRQDGTTQTRGCTIGVDCDTTGKCITASPTTVPKCNPVNYLDNANVSGITEDNSTFTDDSNFIPSDTSTHGFIQGRIKDNNSNAILNDQLFVITHDNLFTSVEKRVGAEIKNLFKTYYSAWGAYPFAAIFSDPSSSTFIGNAAIYYGLPPLGGLDGIGSSINPTWNTIPSISFSSGGTTDGCELRDGNTNNSYWRCNNINLPSGSTITITGTLNNVGKGFWKLHDITNYNEVRARNSIGNYVLTTSVLDNVSVTGSLNSNGSATVIFKGTGRAGIPSIQRIEILDINNYQSIFPSWIAPNHWQQFMYYAVSPGFAPGGGNACTTLPGTPSCLTVYGNGGGNGKHAVIVVTGKVLTAHSHPSGNIRDYLEDENAIPYTPSDPPDFIYENKPRSPNFNDQVIIVAP